MIGRLEKVIAGLLPCRAFDRYALACRLKIGIFINGEIHVQIIADQCRADVAFAGYGAGQRGFVVPFALED
jgi:hypothetical protein